jgi:16S rRNA (guanine(527)-N(7))-methyltransferase RsmG
VNLQKLLEAELRLFQLEVPIGQQALLALYGGEVEKWNRRINLTGLQGLELIRRLIVEPVWIAHQLEIRGNLVDIGSGNGSPALPIHIVRSLERVHLVEARAKRAVFLRHVVSALKLPGVIVHRARFEEVTDELSGVDWITLQGVALTRKLLDSMDSMRRIASRSVTVGWITAEVQPPVKPFQTIRVPITGTQVFLFHLDQF